MMPREIPELDLDFKIYVDPSCLSELMSDETPTTEMPPSPEEVQEEPTVVPETLEEVITEEAVEGTEEVPQGAAAAEARATQEHPTQESDQAPPYVDAAIKEQQPGSEPMAKSSDKPSATEVKEVAQVTAEADETLTREDTPAPEPSPETEAVQELETGSGTGPEPEPVEEPVTETEQPLMPVTDDVVPKTETNDAAEPEQAEQSAADPIPELEKREHHRQCDEVIAPGPSSLITEAPSETPAEDAVLPQATQQAQDEESQDLPDTSKPRPNSKNTNVEEENCDRRRSFVDRKTSLRTEALIQAAARAVVAKIEKRKSGEAVRQDEDDFDNSLLSTGSQDTYILGDDVPSTYIARPSSSRRQSSDTHIRHIPPRSISSDDAGDSSSHNEPDDDVFSDRSARSSLCSLDAHDTDIKTPQAKEHLSRRESYASSTSHSPRAVSGFSTISGLSQYDDKHFIPTNRETRMPFRTPSEIRAMQMASPTPSVFNGSSPRSSKRFQQQSLSRLGSPTVSAQYSPRNRSTPPRLKPRKEAAPLVLLHVTLLPLRWVWGDVLNGLDSVMQGAKALSALDETTTTAEPYLSSFEPSEQLKMLRDAWRELQDRVGDTVLERGILLPHPQNDYEVLEERLLEALELPVRRRARILECGHYLGPANSHALEDESEDEDDLREGKTEEKRHWCNTCRNEIRYEDLGPGKVFRVKVYASNGLMRAGAWEACWKEMERVDVEVEPIVDVVVQNQLERLGVLQLELEEQQRRQELELELELRRTPEPEGLAKRAASPDEALRAPSRQQTEHDTAAQTALMSSPPPSAMQLTQSSTTLVRAATPSPYQAKSRPTEPIDTSEERRRRDEERLREIYGDTGPAPVPAQLPAPPMQAAVEHHHHSQSQPYLQSNALTTAHPPMPLLTDNSSPSLHHRHHTGSHQYQSDPHNTHPTPPPEDIYASGATHHQPASGRRNSAQGQSTRFRSNPIVLDENSGFVELLMEAFKVLLRDPKNVAIIVLCVFVVVMMKHRPGMGMEAGLQVQPGGGAVAPAGAGALLQAYQYQVEPRQEEVLAQVQAGWGTEMGDVVGGQVVEAGGASAKTVESEDSMQVPSPEVFVSEDVASRGTDTVTVIEEGGGMAEVEQTLEVEAVLADEQVSQPEVVGAEEVDGNGRMTDVCALPGLEYPVNMVGGVALYQEEPGVEEAVEGKAEHGSSRSLEEGEQVDLMDSNPIDDAAEAVPSDPDPEAAQTPSSFQAVEGAQTDVEQASDKDEFTAIAPSTDDLDTSIKVPADHKQKPIGDSCEADLDMDEAIPTTTTTSALSSTASLFIPGPFVTERKTVRVFETVTETVRVSVVTQTETVSTVVTAVPQTVEETVYETETVRITVSVPVEEQMGAKAKAKAKGTKGCKKGWF
ncbi:hypothetical protein N657DRAFT_647319 [Parathielavia appendiculata]|uniref:Pathway-specific nitrogen regulator n=1 Tax=Parathielavia appendiculata TaxID=2587402 RepID=A0AAN6TWC4_9PEZI|nr:hypothetical protein N657DRAFT_647319 [Parathielavia appendiculata]